MRNTVRDKKNRNLNTVLIIIISIFKAKQRGGSINKGWVRGDNCLLANTHSIVHTHCMYQQHAEYILGKHTRCTTTTKVHKYIFT